MIDMKIMDKKGFTLIEILIAITVFAIGILAVAKMHISAIEGNRFTRDMTTALNIAQSEIERLLALNYNNVLLKDTNGDGDDNGNDFGLNNDNTTHPADHSAQYRNTSKGSIKYNIFWNIAVDKPTTGCKHIRVIVRWSDKKSPKEIKMDAVKAEM